MTRFHPALSSSSRQIDEGLDCGLLTFPLAHLKRADVVEEGALTEMRPRSEGAFEQGVRRKVVQNVHYKVTGGLDLMEGSGLVVNSGRGASSQQVSWVDLMN